MISKTLKIPWVFIKQVLNKKAERTTTKIRRHEPIYIWYISEGTDRRKRTNMKVVEKCVDNITI